MGHNYNYNKIRGHKPKFRILEFCLYIVVWLLQLAIFSSTKMSGEEEENAAELKIGDGK